ncbi:uncharacterized protein BDW70DRAFT_129896 [Aspergillus foveolatus]|uniref:uncharacterized protein n=1 Tax=Aspergillus foveolatus TaxID=210207 RepID=UPI003CCD0CAF
MRRYLGSSVGTEVIGILKGCTCKRALTRTPRNDVPGKDEQKPSGYIPGLPRHGTLQP